MEVNVYFDGPMTEIDMGPRAFSVIPAAGPAGADGQPGRDGTIENLSVAATTLPAGSDATASYSGNLLTLGIPTGATGAAGQNGVGVPTGGTTGQVLKKKSGTNYDAEWANESGGGTWGSITGTLSNQTDLYNALGAKADSARGLPTGGTYGKVLQKYSSTDYDVGWGAIHDIPYGGTTGQALVKSSGSNYAVEWGDVLPCLVVSCGTISSLPATISNSSITADMVALKGDFGTPGAQVSDWTFTTAAGSVTISGTLATGGSTTLTLYLIKSR